MKYLGLQEIIRGGERWKPEDRHRLWFQGSKKILCCYNTTAKTLLIVKLNYLKKHLKARSLLFTC